MHTVEQILSELAACGSPSTVAIYKNHGAPSNIFGCKVSDLKVIAKKIKGQQELALALYDTGNADAMYLAGIVADGAKMTKRQLQSWAKSANWHMVSEYSVPGVACENEAAWELGLKWIETPQAHVSACGWATLSGVLATRSDDALDLPTIKTLLKRIEAEIHEADNRVRYTMNGFVIAVGTYVKPLLSAAKATAKKIGPVKVDMGKTACKVPLATDSIQKVESMSRVGKKRKTVKC